MATCLPKNPAASEVLEVSSLFKTVSGLLKLVLDACEVPVCEWFGFWIDCEEELTALELLDEEELALELALLLELACGSLLISTFKSAFSFMVFPMILRFIATVYFPLVLGRSKVIVAWLLACFWIWATDPPSIWSFWTKFAPLGIVKTSWYWPLLFLSVALESKKFAASERSFVPCFRKLAVVATVAESSACTAIKGTQLTAVAPYDPSKPKSDTDVITR